MLQPHTGLICATPTPFDPAGRVNEEQIARLAGHLVEHEMDGAFVCGTTGESTSLTLAERQQVAARWRQETPADLRLIVHVGHLCVEDACALARHAAEIGADAIAAMPPSFIKPRGLTELVSYCRQVAAAAPELPFYYYHIPMMTGVWVPMYDFLRAAGEEIPSLCGVKFTHSDLHDFGRCLMLDEGRWAMLFGLDEMLLAALALGARGGVGGTYGMAPRLYRELFDAWAEDDLETAQARQHTSREMIAEVLALGVMPSVKAAYRLIGIDCGSVRTPLSDLSPADASRLADRFAALDLLPSPGANHPLPR